jgi:hypothetical protein
VTLRDLHRRLGNVIQFPRRAMGNQPISQMTSGEMRLELCQIYARETGHVLEADITTPLPDEVREWAKGLA